MGIDFCKTTLIFLCEMNLRRVELVVAGLMLGGAKKGKKKKKATSEGAGCEPSHQDFISQCIDKTVLESQLPHKTVNLVFHLVTVNNKLKLMILWGN